MRAGDELVGVLGVRLRAQLGAQVDRREHPDLDLGRQREAQRQVEQRDAERRRHLDREHLQPQRLVELQRARDAAALAEEQRGLLAADRHHGRDRGVELERELDEARAPARSRSGPAPSSAGRSRGRRPGRRAARRRGPARRACCPGWPGTVPKRLRLARTPGTWKTRSWASWWKRPVGAEVVVEVLGEDERVGDQRAAGVVADEQHRARRPGSRRARRPRRGSRRRSRRGSRAAPRGCTRGRGRRASPRTACPFARPSTSSERATSPAITLAMA